MIEIRYSPKGLAFQVDPERPHFRFKSPSAKSVKPPALPSRATPPSEIISQAAQVGETEGRRLRKRTGRRATRLTNPSLASVPANVARAGLITKLGGV